MNPRRLTTLAFTACALTVLVQGCLLIWLLTPPDPANESYVDSGIRVDWSRSARSSK